MYETYNPGAADTVYVRNPNTGEWENVWSGTASFAGAEARIFMVYFPLTDYNVSDIRISINSPAVTGWNEYDAVSVSQETPPPLWVNTMPSNAVSSTYANAVAGRALDVWGNVKGGSAPYTFKLDFGDGNSVSGSVVDPHFIGEMHTFQTAGPKTMMLTVYDAAGDSAKDQALINVFAVPGQQIEINMAIEKGLLYLYKNQFPDGSWFDSYGNSGATGSALLAFEENGHLPTNNYDVDIYAEYVRAGINYLATNALTWEIFDQPHGNPDSDGDSMGVYLNYTGSGGAYSNGVGLLAFLGAHKSAESAQSDIGSYSALGYSSSSPEISQALDYINVHWFDIIDERNCAFCQENFNGNLYAMYAVAKGMRIIDNRIGIELIGIHDWYSEYANHLTILK